MATSIDAPGGPGEQERTSLGTEGARKLAHTTKSVPQMQDISPRWLLRMLPWVQVQGGVFRVNRRLTYTLDDGRVGFVNTGTAVSVIPRSLTVLPLLRGFDDPEVLHALAGRFVQREVKPGELIVERGQPAQQVVLLAHGKAQKLGPGAYGAASVLETLSDGAHFGDQAVVESDDRWSFSVKAVTACTVLQLPEQVFEGLVAQHPALRARVAEFRELLKKPQDKHGQAAIELSAGHHGEPVLPGTFVDYDPGPREYELGVVQTILKVHTRVSDLFNIPMDQFEEQLRLTIEAIRERQEHELINNREFGLLHNADLKQRIPTRHGPPTPADMDDLLGRRRKTQLFLAHPLAIAAFHGECNKRGVYPTPITVQGKTVAAWRNVPILPCDKLPISDSRTTSILAMRLGEKDQGVVGLHQTGIADEVQPSLSVRRMDIGQQAIASYLVSAYFSAAVLIPDALGVLEDVQLG